MAGGKGLGFGGEGRAADKRLAGLSMQLHFKPESAQLGAGADAHGPRTEPGKQGEEGKTRVGARGGLLEAEGTKHCQEQGAVGQGR